MLSNIIWAIVGAIGTFVAMFFLNKKKAENLKKEKEKYEKELDNKSDADIVDMLDNTDDIQRIKSESDENINDIATKYKNKYRTKRRNK